MKGEHPGAGSGLRGSVLKRRFRRYIGQFVALLLGLSLGLVALPLILAGEIYDYQDSIDGVHLPDVDAIVCLAGGRGRISAAGDLWYRYFEASRVPRVLKILGGGQRHDTVPVLYISGTGPQSSWPILRKQLRSGVREVVQPEHVLIENESFNTEANARWLARHISHRTGPRWNRIILVTSPYHMKRAQLIFQRIFQASGIPVQIDTLSAFQEPFEPGEWRSSLHGIHVTLVEYVKWIYYRFFWTA